MADTPDPAELPENIDELLAAFEAGELDADPEELKADAMSDEQRRGMLSAARLIHRALPTSEPPPELRAQVLERIRAESKEPPAPVADLVDARKRRARRRGLIAAAASSVAAVIVAVLLAATPGGHAPPVLLFDAEIAGVRTGPAPAAGGGSDISRLGDGYVVHLELEGLVPTRGYSSYELWYVGKGDTAARPNRVAIGSFRTADGKIDARWPAAFDLGRFTRVSITLQPPDNGNPSLHGPEVAGGRSVRKSGKQTR